MGVSGADVKVGVAGLWHLGAVTAGCLARAGHDVVAVDPAAAVVAAINAGKAPLFEPGLDDLLAEAVTSRRLWATVDPAAVARCDVVWITFDTPVDDDDRADVAAVVHQIHRLFPFFGDATVLISSQLPVGSAARIAEEYRRACPEGTASFAVSPENLRLGKAIEVFTHPDRVVVGVDTDRDRERIAALLAPITDRIEWMRVASAEMTKHAINTFLALSVTFINEVATLCELTGADAREVERGLRTEQRIGPRAYVSPGAAFAGGTLARDAVFLAGLAREHGLNLEVVDAITRSNARHRGWPLRTVAAALGELEGKTIAVWGLVYKPGTDTLRRSPALELMRDLTARGAAVRAFDPRVRALGGAGVAGAHLAADAFEAAQGADALVVATEWPEFRELDPERVLRAMRRRVVVDPNRFLASSFGGRGDVQYLAVGTPRP